MIGKQFRDAVCRVCPHRLVWNKDDQCCYEANMAHKMPRDKRPPRQNMDLMDACPDPARRSDRASK